MSSIPKESLKNTCSQSVSQAGKLRKELPPRNDELSVMSTLFSKCLCAGPQVKSSPSRIELVALKGIECIALGAVSDEHSAKEQVELTIKTVKLDRIVYVGYLANKELEVIPFDAWKATSSNSDNHIIPLDVGTVIEQLKVQEYDQAIKTLMKMHRSQVQKNQVGLECITLHNIGVVYSLQFNFLKSLSYFEKACQLKQKYFGESHPELAVSLVEAAILNFALQKYTLALSKFDQALHNYQVLSNQAPQVAMILNNVACVHFKQGNPLNALGTFCEASRIQQHALGGSQNPQIDLLHVATTLGNIGYIQLQLKNYDQALAVLEDALLVQQSVLGDDHKTVKDTLNNIEFANAFHS